jgi:CHAD domain-containing protein
MKAKDITGLDCSAPAEQMIPHVLRAKIKSMCAFRKKALDWSDPEGVHAMRVRSRRLRGAISDFEPHRKQRALPIAKLRAIARSLGAVRDEDVAIPALEKLQSETRGEIADGIELLLEERRQRRDTARRALEKAISPAAVREFRLSFESKLRDAKSATQTTAAEPVEPGPTFREIGGQVIAERLKDLRKAGPHIFFPSENSELHELRILCKRLRYAVELFAACGGDEMRSMAKEIALLQTSLGELHDCDVWIDDLGIRLKRAAREDKRHHDHAGRVAACSWLLKHFVKVRSEHYRDALSRWQEWEAEGFLENLRAAASAKQT